MSVSPAPASKTPGRSQPLRDSVTQSWSLALRLLPGSLRLSVARVQLGLADLRAAFHSPQRAVAWRPPAGAVTNGEKAQPARATPARRGLTPDAIAARLRAGQERRRQRLASAAHAWPTAPAGITHQVRYAKSGTLLAVDDDRSLLQAGLDAGLELTFSCGLGGCGSCKTRLLSGVVELQEPNCLSADERAEGYILPCVTRPLAEVVLEA